MPASNIWGDTDQETWGPHIGKWVANRNDVEISVVREDFKHGFRSLGWDTPNAKIILWNCNNGEPPPEIWKAAEFLSEKMNNKDKE